MEQSVDQPSLESSDRSLDEVQRQASDQLERELREGQANVPDKSLCRQQTVSLTISPNYVKQWDSTSAFRELYQNW
jgi:hypothetical protein